jgi:hypothetical protein
VDVSWDMVRSIVDTGWTTLQGCCHSCRAVSRDARSSKKMARLDRLICYVSCLSCPFLHFIPSVMFLCFSFILSPSLFLPFRVPCPLFFRHPHLVLITSFHFVCLLSMLRHPCFSPIVVMFVCSSPFDLPFFVVVCVCCAFLIRSFHDVRTLNVLVVCNCHYLVSPCHCLLGHLHTLVHALVTHPDCLSFPIVIALIFAPSCCRAFFDSLNQGKFPNFSCDAALWHNTHAFRLLLLLTFVTLQMHSNCFSNSKSRSNHSAVS